MNSWKIIKKQMDSGYQVNTVGKIRDLVKASEVFCGLLGKLNDKEEAMKEFNDDAEVREALLRQKDIKALRDAGVIR